MNVKNHLITGLPGTGKSTLCREVLKEQGLSASGYITLPYQKEDCWGFELISLQDPSRRAPISQVFPDGRVVPLPETFSGLGVSLLKEALTDPSPLILMDEIGRFEAGTPEFIRLIHQVLDSPKAVLAVLKKEPIPFIQKLKERADVSLYDLDDRPPSYIIEEITHCLAVGKKGS